MVLPKMERVKMSIRNLHTRIQGLAPVLPQERCEAQSEAWRTCDAPTGSRSWNGQLGFLEEKIS